MPKKKPEVDEHGQKSFSIWLSDALKNTLEKRARKMQKKLGESIRWSLGQHIKYLLAKGMAAEDAEVGKRQGETARRNRAKREAAARAAKNSK